MNIAAIEQQISPAVLVTYLGCEWNKERTCVRCPRHKGGREKDPSARVYQDHIYCFSCGSYWGVLGFARDWLGLSFSEAMLWLQEHLDEILATPAQAIVICETSAAYQGPAPREMADYWHSCLQAEQREWLHQRLITDDTIDRLLIGWRPDWKAYSIPFWRGDPLHSEIDIIQFRLTEGKGKRYVGLRGHNRPSLINQHVIGQHSLVLLFGTFDAILAAQDGLAAVSTNGAAIFMRNQENVARLKGMIQCRKVYVVPDKTEVESRAAYLLAQVLSAEVRHFPAEAAGKDYTDFRVSGKRPLDFLTEVLMMPVAITDPDHDQIVADILFAISSGRFDTAETLFQCLEVSYKAPLVNHQLQIRMQFDPFSGLSHDQWEKLRDSITTCLTYPKLLEWAKGGCLMAHDNQGGF